MMVSLAALSKTGLWNQLYKIGHAAYLARWFIPFMIYCRDAVAQPQIFSFLKAVRKHEASNLPLGVAGFCWGGKHVTKLCWDQEKTDDGKRLIDCGYVAHPSMLKYPSDIEGIKLPYSCAAASIDPQMTDENAKQTKEILVSKTAKTKDHGVEHEFVMYDGAHHGFAVRADEDDLEEAARGQKAEAQVSGLIFASAYVNTELH
jgi:dienelactone hydrolase